MRFGSVLRPRRPGYGLRVEELEPRDCPAGMTPTLSLNVMPAGPMLYTVSGFVMDEAPGGLSVQLSGVYSGAVQTNCMGMFSVNVTPSQLGTITATVTDNEGLVSVPVQRACSSIAPSITLAANRLVNNVWTFTGMVVDEYAAGLTVTLGGLASLANKQATVGANGMFSLTVELAQGEEGTATALTYDWWGHASNVAQCIIQPTV